LDLASEVVDFLPILCARVDRKQLRVNPLVMSLPLGRPKVDVLDQREQTVVQLLGGRDDVLGCRFPHLALFAVVDGLVVSVVDEELLDEADGELEGERAGRVDELDEFGLREREKVPRRDQLMIGR
jgi:hypothetical protein